MPVLLLMVSTASLLPLPRPDLAKIEVAKQQDTQGDEEDCPGLGQGTGGTRQEHTAGEDRLVQLLPGTHRMPPLLQAHVASVFAGESAGPRPRRAGGQRLPPPHSPTGCSRCNWRRLASVLAMSLDSFFWRFKAATRRALRP